MASALETLCRQAYGAKRYHMLGIYLQRSWIVLFICSILLTPMFVFASPMLKLIGQPTSVAEHTGIVAVWLIPLHLSFPFQLTLQRFLQSQLKTAVISWVSGGALLLHVIALVGLPEFFKLSVASGVMLSLENFYYWVLIIASAYMHNTEVAVDALSICVTIYGWESMIPLGFLAGTGVRVSNELGAGNAHGAKFAAIVSTLNSLLVGLFFWSIIVAIPEKLAMIFTSSSAIVAMVNELAVLLAFTILLNCIQPVLSGVSVGSGWQALVAFINIGSYYIVGVPLGIVIGWLLHFDITVSMVALSQALGQIRIYRILMRVMKVDYTYCSSPNFHVDCFC